MIALAFLRWIACDSRPPPHPQPSTTAWGVENITIYISHWYNGVFRASTAGLQHEFFHVRRVRVRANPWFAENAAGKSGAITKTRGRSVDYAIPDMQVKIEPFLGLS